jgi:septal ring factor EnvC (AmiA/AmiB activator)
MEWLKSKTTLVAACCLAIVGVQGYGLMSMRSTMDERVTSVESDYAVADEKLTVLASDLDVVAKRLGITTKELQAAQAEAKQLKQENTQLARRLRRELAAKADTKAVAKLQEEAASRLNAVHQEATTKIDGVSGEVRIVRSDLDATRSDLKATRSDLNAARDELANNRRDLGTLIARNSSELADLRRKGERDYVEFDIRKGKEFRRIGDVLVQLKKTDVKRQKYEVVINADDSAIQKKDRTANEPVTFLVGRDRMRYELVVNHVEKDRIRGYMSAPKNAIGADMPTLRVQ